MSICDKFNPNRCFLISFTSIKHEQPINDLLQTAFSRDKYTFRIILSCQETRPSHKNTHLSQLLQVNNNSFPFPRFFYPPKNLHIILHEKPPYPKLAQLLSIPGRPWRLPIDTHLAAGEHYLMSIRSPGVLGFAASKVTHSSQDGAKGPVINYRESGATKR